MQVYTKFGKHSIYTFLFFLVILFIAFLPVSSFMFFLKNDAFTGYFAPKFFISESISAGYLPLWNPYINFGLPQYGDMSSAYWNPFTWLIASTVGYNAYTFTLETLLYLFIGSIGMYKLTSFFKLNKNVRLIAGISFMCCGYNVGHLQHFNWLSGATFLPWCLWSYLVLLHQFSWKHLISCVLLFYMLISAAHPGIIICSIYFFAAIFIFYFFKIEKNSCAKLKLLKAIKCNGILVLLLIIVSAGMIVGYADILPYFSRGEKISLAASLSNPTSLQCWISTLLPLSTVKNNTFFNTDISMRNCYFGVTFFLFFVNAAVTKKNKWQKFLLMVGLVFALLSSGGVFKIFAYHFIPLIGYVRLDGEFSIFAIMCFIIVAAISLNKFIETNKNFDGAIKIIYYFFEITLFILLSFFIVSAFLSNESFLFSITKILQQQTASVKLKTLIDAISSSDTIWMQSIIQLIILWLVKWCIKNKNWQLLTKIVAIDMIVACLLNIPFTGVGKTSLAQVQSILNKSPKGIPMPPLQALNKNDTLSSDEKNTIGDWSMYNKQIGVVNEVNYPIVLKNTIKYFSTPTEKSKILFQQKPFVFNALTAIDSVKIISFSPNKIVIKTVNDSADKLIVLKQNYYPHWHYEVHNIKYNANIYGINFMSGVVSKTQSKITFCFEPKLVKYAMLVSLVAFVLLCILLFSFSFVDDGTIKEL